jgi:RND family efflux transporter MFP subunit
MPDQVRHDDQKITSKETSMNMTRKTKIITAASAALILIGIVSLTFGKPSVESGALKKEDAVNVQTLAVSPRTIDASVSAAGTLNSRNSSVLSSKIMGKVAELNVHEGDYVTEGQVLLRIESGEIAAQAYQAQAAFNTAKLQFDRIKSLFDAKAATQMEMEQATLGLESAKAGLNAAKAMESYTVLTAPIAGQIVEKKINLGEMALPGQPVLKIEDNRNLRLEATVSEQDIAAIRPNMQVTIQIDALPGKDVKARVSQIVPAADSRTHSFIVKIDVPAHSGLITGMYGRALFSIGKRAAILVPNTALVTMSGLTGVYLVSADKTAVFQMIQQGEIRGDMIEAVTGLKAGDTIVVSKQQTSIDGRKIVVATK